MTICLQIHTDRLTREKESLNLFSREFFVLMFSYVYKRRRDCFDRK